MTTIPIDQALKEELSSQDITRTAQIEPKKEPPIRLKSQPQPTLLASNPKPSLIHQETSKRPDRKAGVKMAEALDPTPNRDMAART